MNAQSTVPLHTGRRMPVLGLGTWELTDATADTVDYALRLGWRMIDTACDYGSQPGIGEAMRRHAGERDSIYLVAKVEETDDAYQATREYLGEIGVERADLMLIHRPPDQGVGRELWEGLARARSEGLTRDIGVSNYSIEQLRQLEQETGERPVVNQIEWSPFGYSEQMVAYCAERQIVIQAYSPLTRAERLDDEKLVELARRYGRSPAQILIRWNLQRGTVPLPKANRREHLEENIRALDFSIDSTDMAALDRFNEHWSSLGSLPYV